MSRLSRSFLSFFFVGILSVTMTDFAAAGSWHPKPHLQVEGTASLELEADQVTISASFQATNKDSSLAIQALEQHLAPLIADLKRGLTPSKDFSAGEINIQPKQEQIDKRWQVVGYTASRNINLTNISLKQASKWLETVTEYKPHGLNLNYSSSQASAQTNKLLELAVKNAQEKATAMTKGTKQKLGNALEIVELGSAYPVMRNYALAASPSADAQPAFSLVPSQQEISARVRVIFELK